jgi:hypothetical protein
MSRGTPGPEVTHGTAPTRRPTWPAGRRGLALAAGALLGAAAGCGGGGEKLLPVRGKVTLDGQVLTVGAVSFRPDAARGNASKHVPTGPIAADGTYELITLKRQGAPPGWYKVVVFADANALKPGGTAHPLPPAWLTKPRYRDEKTTDLSVEVVEAPRAGAYDLKLTR